MMNHAKSIETELFRAYFDDGLLDVFFGSAAVGIGICWALDLVALGAIVPVVLIPFWAPLRRRLIEPRAGVVEFSNDRTDTNRRMLFAAAWLGVAALVLFAGLYWLAAPPDANLARNVIAAVPAWLIGLLAALLGAGLRVARFALYTSLFLASGLAITMTGSEPEVAIIAGGLLTALGGGMLLARFLTIEAEPGTGR